MKVVASFGVQGEEDVLTLWVAPLDAFASQVVDPVEHRAAGWRVCRDYVVNTLLAAEQKKVDHEVASLTVENRSFLKCMKTLATNDEANVAVVITKSNSEGAVHDVRSVKYSEVVQNYVIFIAHKLILFLQEHLLRSKEVAPSSVEIVLCHSKLPRLASALKKEASLTICKSYNLTVSPTMHSGKITCPLKEVAPLAPSKAVVLLAQILTGQKHTAADLPTECDQKEFVEIIVRKISTLMAPMAKEPVVIWAPLVAEHCIILAEALTIYPGLHSVLLPALESVVWPHPSDPMLVLLRVLQEKPEELATLHHSFYVSVEADIEDIRHRQRNLQYIQEALSDGSTLRVLVDPLFPDEDLDSSFSSLNDPAASPLANPLPDSDSCATQDPRRTLH